MNLKNQICNYLCLLLVCRPALNPLSHTNQGLLFFFFYYQEKFIEIFYVASPGPFWWPYYGCLKRSILYFLGIEYTLIYVPYKCYLGLLYNYLFCQFIFLFFNFNFLLLFNYSCVPFLPIPPPHPSPIPIPPPPPPSKKKGN